MRGLLLLNDWFWALRRGLLLSPGEAHALRILVERSKIKGCFDAQRDG